MYTTFMSFYQEEIIKISILDPGYLVTYVKSVKISLNQMNVL